MTPERFDIYDESQNWIGTAPRHEVHAQGYWHRSFHCWLVRDEGKQRMVLFQRRRDTKDTFPGCYDITAAGHLTAGEQLHEASRELEEELGVAVPFEALTHLLTVKQQLQGEVRGVPFIDNEISAVYGLCVDQPLEAYTLQASEVDSLYEVPLNELLALFRGQTDRVKATGIQAEYEDSGDHGPLSVADKGSSGSAFPFKRVIRQVRAADFAPHGTTYYTEILEALHHVPGCP